MQGSCSLYTGRLTLTLRRWPLDRVPVGRWSPWYWSLGRSSFSARDGARNPHNQPPIIQLLIQRIVQISIKGSSLKFRSPRLSILIAKLDDLQRELLASDDSVALTAPGLRARSMALASLGEILLGYVAQYFALKHCDLVYVICSFELSAPSHRHLLLPLSCCACLLPWWHNFDPGPRPH